MSIMKSKMLALLLVLFALVVPGISYRYDFDGDDKKDETAEAPIETETEIETQAETETESESPPHYIESIVKMTLLSANEEIRSLSLEEAIFVEAAFSTAYNQVHKGEMVMDSVTMDLARLVDVYAEDDEDDHDNEEDGEDEDKDEVEDPNQRNLRGSWQDYVRDEIWDGVEDYDVYWERKIQRTIDRIVSDFLARTSVHWSFLHGCTYCNDYEDSWDRNYDGTPYQYNPHHQRRLESTDPKDKTKTRRTMAGLKFDRSLKQHRQNELLFCTHLREGPFPKFHDLDDCMITYYSSVNE